ncbi:hypothetical protein GS462_24290 [Rhodococcus hoagii]|nr:hypothetical protein [Prescottella equi]
MLAGVVLGDVGAEAARRHGVSDMSVSKWKQHSSKPAVSGSRNRRPGRHCGTVDEPRLLSENEQLELTLAEAVVQLRIWQHGAKLVDQVPRNPRILREAEPLRET